MAVMNQGLGDKLYYSIGEVSRITDLPQSVLRYWETEFKELSPQRSRSGKRAYRQSDIARILKIKKLLYDRRFTIEGAKGALKQRDLGDGESPQEAASDSEKPQLGQIRQELSEILELLKG